MPLDQEVQQKLTDGDCQAVKLVFNEDELAHAIQRAVDACLPRAVEVCLKEWLENHFSEHFDSHLYSPSKPSEASVTDPKAPPVMISKESQPSTMSEPQRSGMGVSGTIMNQIPDTLTSATSNAQATIAFQATPSKLSSQSWTQTFQASDSFRANSEVSRAARASAISELFSSTTRPMDRIRKILSQSKSDAGNKLAMPSPRSWLPLCQSDQTGLSKSAS